MNRLKKITLLLLLCLGFLIRLYRFTSPVADWHSFRQVDTLSVSRIFQSEGIDLLRPRYHDLSSLQSGRDNPRGFRMVEFPVYNLFSVLTAKFTSLTIDNASRLVSIILSLLTAWLIYKIVFEYTRSFLPSIFSLAVFLFLPYSVFYSRTTLPEPTAVFFMVLFFWLFSKNIYLAFLSLTLSVLVKPYTLLLTTPFIILFTPLKKIPKNYLLLVLSLVPFYLWRRHIAQFPEGIPQSDWLLNNSSSTTFPVWYRGVNLSFLNRLIAFRPHWWHWLFSERIGILILGTYGLIPAFLGFLYRKNKTQSFLFSLLLGIFLYFIVVAGGNIQHDYYQVLIVPFVAIFVGIGFYFLYRFAFNSRIIACLVMAFLAFLTLLFGYTKTIDFYNIDHPELLEAGKIARMIIPPGSLLIAPYNGDTSLLYHTGFSGWPVEIYDFDRLKNTHPGRSVYFLSTVNDRYTADVLSRFTPVYTSDQLFIAKISP